MKERIIAGLACNRHEVCVAGNNIVWCNHSWNVFELKTVVIQFFQFDGDTLWIDKEVQLFAHDHW